MGLITETNAHYYSGQQAYVALNNGTGTPEEFLWEGNVVLKPTITGIQNTNYQVIYRENPLVENVDYTLNNGVVSTAYPHVKGDIFIIQLLEQALEDNYGGYAYISLKDIINNFIVAYVGEEKLIPRVKRTDVMFHAKRGLQEFSYDTLKSIKSQELTVPNSLSLVMPEDYVQHVKMSYIGDDGVKYIVYPTTLTSNPSNLPIQDTEGVPIQDSFGQNISDDISLARRGWINNKKTVLEKSNEGVGQMYGLNPATSQSNGWFTTNNREGKISFSANMVDKVVILDYISDGLAYDADTKVPKLAEEAMYAHLSYSLLAGRANQPEYVIKRLKQEKSAKLRNAKIRISNIKPLEITRVLRGKSKWIK